MPAGLIVRGDHGLYQVDDTTFCLSIMAHGTLASAAHSVEPTIGIDLYTITFAGDQPIFALYLPDGDTIGGVFKTSFSSGVWTVLFAVASIHGVGSINASAIHWFALDRPKTVSGAGAGLRVWDAAGKMTFSSEWETVVPSFSFSPGRKYAGIGGRLTFRRDLNTDQLSDLTWIYHAWQTAEGFTCAGGAPSAGEVIYSDMTGAGTGGGSTGYMTSNIINPLYGVDVTGLVP